MILASLTSLGSQFPIFIVLVVGIVLSLANRQRLGTSATLALVGLVILLIESVFGTLIGVLLPQYAIRQGMSASQIGVVFGAIGIIRSLIAAVAFGCLLLAIFRQR